MYLFISIFLFSNYFLINGLHCMTNIAGTILSTIRCEFVLNISDPIPEDDELLKQYNLCSIHLADSVTIFGVSDGSCFADIDIDYIENTMSVHLTHVTAAQSFVSPYDDMFGFFNNINNVVQFKIAGNLENEKIHLIARVQCRTSNNCALAKLRDLLSNLTDSHTRLNIFKDIIKLLRISNSAGVSTLRCLYNDNDIECLDTEYQCIFDFSKGVLKKSGCSNSKAIGLYDLEYRFNVIEELASDTFDSVHNAFKFYYLCNTDLCNNDATVTKVDHLLYSFALGSSKNDPSTYESTSYIKTAPPLVPKPLVSANPKRSSATEFNGVSFNKAFYIRLVIIICLFIEILST